jgi:hypothetical protein
MTLKKIDPKTAKIGTTVGTFSEEDLQVFMRAKRKIQAAKVIVDKVTDTISKNIDIQADIWEKYVYDEETTEELAKRGLALSMNGKTGEIKIEQINEKEKLKMLMPYIY